MSFSEVIGTAWRDNVLLSVFLELTYRCNLDCFFCYNDLSARGRAMRLPDYIRVLDELAEMQVLDVTLTGGEPLAHPDFFAIGSAARERGFAVRVKTNGHAIRADIARRLRDEVDPFTVDVSLHGACEETHDRLTRVAGSFTRLIANLELMKELGFRVRINAVLTIWNQNEVEAMYAIADRLGMPMRFDATITPRDNGDLEPLNINATPEGVRNLYRIQVDRARAAGELLDLSRPVSDGDAAAPGKKHCGAGSSVIAIDPFGNVYPCVSWRVPAGNVHTEPLRLIWSESGALESVRKTTAGVAEMVASEGPVGKLMAFCPGTSQTRSGRPDIVTEDVRGKGQILLDLME